MIDNIIIDIHNKRKVNNMCEYCRSTNYEENKNMYIPDYDGDYGYFKVGYKKLHTLTTATGCCDNYDTEDEIDINYCPMCGKILKK